MPKVYAGWRVPPTLWKTKLHHYPGIEVLRLLKVLCNSGGWSCTEADCDFAIAWDKGHMEITKELLSKALLPTPAPGADKDAK